MYLFIHVFNIFICMYIYIYIYVIVYVYMHMYIYAYTYIYIYTFIYTHTYAYVHVYIHRKSWAFSPAAATADPLAAAVSALGDPGLDRNIAM